MGEYAERKSDGEKVKIGTCDAMYYLRYTDKHKVDYTFGQCEFFWRLPYPDEDNILPGDYEQYNRGLRLYKSYKNERGQTVSENFVAGNAADIPGVMQLRHDCGLMFNVLCYHGTKLPETNKDITAFWNGRGWFFELAFVKNTKDGILPIVRCRVCGQMWRCDWIEIFPYVPDKEIEKRLKYFRREKEINYNSQENKNFAVIRKSCLEFE